MILPLESNLLPVITPEIHSEINADPKWQVDQKAQCVEEPWFWIVNYAYTIRRDENTDASTVERFPADEYLRYIFHQCFVEKNLAIDKSRQMRITWLMMAYELWWAQFRENELIVCQTKKKEDADEELIKKAHIIWRGEPSWMKPALKAGDKSFCRMEFPSLNSIILGIPNGEDQIRSHNPGRVFIDEGGFMEGEFEGNRTAALACAKDIKCVSTANAGDWEDFIYDSIAA